jgi:hypothetical protein
MRPRSVMVDLETKSTSVNAFILSIGAVSILDDGFLSGYDLAEPVTFYGQVPWNDPTQAERSVDASTLDWWSHQGQSLTILQSPNEQQREWVYPCIKPLLEGFSAFCREQIAGGGKLMSKGTDFDIAILRSAMDEYDVEQGWHYNKTRCMRGFLDAAYAAGASRHLDQGIYGGNPGIKHHAADDAIWQAMIYVRYHHELWKIMHKSAQKDLFTDGVMPTRAATQGPRPGTSFTGTTAGATLLPAPTLKDAP